MSDSTSTARRATVIGAGLVGLCTALYLQRAGFTVRLIDRDPPGEGASFGNAGVIAIDSVEPVATPGVMAQVPRMLLNDLAPLSIRWGYMPRLAPWLIRFILASRPARVEEISIALKDICNQALAAYLPLMEAVGAMPMLKRGGWLSVFETDAGFARAKASIALRRRRGVNMEILRAEEVRQMEPALSPAIRHAVHFPDYCWVTDPLRLSQTLADGFRHHGGELVRAEVKGFEVGADGPRRVLTDSGGFDIAGDVVVIAAGAHSRVLAKQLGAGVPLDTERGYHVMLPEPGVELRIPVSHAEWGFVGTPMENGLRFAGTVELGGLDAPPNWRRADVLLRHARRVYPELNTDGAEPWMGFRPSMPDSLPVVGPSPRHPNVYLAFGHGHLGLTLAAISGAMIAAMATGQAPAVDPTPFRADRF